eukprot:90992-Rhodomonas_salina.6
MCLFERGEDNQLQCVWANYAAKSEYELDPESSNLLNGMDCKLKTGGYLQIEAVLKKVRCAIGGCEARG